MMTCNSSNGSDDRGTNNSLSSRAQVLVSGGGPVGLAAALELGRRGITCVVIEPRETVSHARPRCKTMNARTMEHLRRWGIADKLRERAPLSTEWSQDVVFCTSLSGHEISRFSGVFGLAERDRSAEPGQQAPQFVFEELMRDEVAALETCTVVTGVRVVGLDQDADAVRVSVADADGVESEVLVDYVIGCDGGRSAVRELIGSTYVGSRALRPNFGMVFESQQLWDEVAHGPAVHYWTVNRDAPAIMGPLDLSGLWWLIALNVDQETGERDGRAIIDAAAGVPVEATIVSTDPWTARMEIVDRMRSGRVFLAGDAAHLNPPFGGHGLNTGIGDAVDLGWKLWAVLDGWAGAGLLDTYESERRPIQDRIIREAVSNMQVTSRELYVEGLDADGEAGVLARAAADSVVKEAKTAEFHSLDLVLGIGFLDGPDTVSEGLRVGARLPHVWLGDGHSIYDALGPGLSLLIVNDVSAASVSSFVEVARSRGIPLAPVDLREHSLRERIGAGLILVRPDQLVAWSADDLPEDIGHLLGQVAGIGGVAEVTA